MDVLTETNLKSVQLLSRGKVRDIYEGGKDTLLIVTTDRISSYDQVMKEGIPGKGAVLNSLSLFWKNMFHEDIPNDIVETDSSKIDFLSPEEQEICKGRCALVRKLDVFKFEFIVRGYLCGSAWKMYKEKGKIVDVVPPLGLRLSSKFPLPIFTPTTKETVGHDKPVSWDQLSETLGEYVSMQIKEISVKIYEKALKYTTERGIVIADTKFEFACGKSGELYLVDEVLTPDSSRLWPADSIVPGENPSSLDKQILRDWLDEQGWDRNSTPPNLPDSLVEKMSKIYQDIHSRLIN